MGKVEWLSMETVLVHCGELGVENVDDWLRLLGVKQLWVSPERWWVHRFWYELALHAIMDRKDDMPIVWDDQQWERALRLSAWYDQARKNVGPLELSENHRKQIEPLVFARRAIEEAYREQSERIAEEQGFSPFPEGFSLSRGDGSEEVSGSGVDRGGS